MPQVSTLAPERARALASIARVLLSAVRNATFYPLEHPAVAASLKRIAPALQAAVRDGVSSVGVTPDTLLVGDIGPENPDGFVRDAAALLHDHGILQFSFDSYAVPEALSAFIRLLSTDPMSLWDEGGPAVAWQRQGHSTIRLVQIDYRLVMKDRPPAKTGHRGDDLWRSIVRSLSDGRLAFDELTQQRLLEIAENAGEITALAQEIIAPKCAADGSPMVTTQTGTVLAAFRHLASIGSVLAPGRYNDIIRNLAIAASALSPNVVMALLQSEDKDRPGEFPIAQELVSAFDDERVAHLLATVLAAEGHASNRLADVFGTLLPDPERRQHVLSLARAELAGSEFGGSDAFKAIWGSVETLLVSYNETAYVTDDYRAQLDGARERSSNSAVVPPPEEMPEWLNSVGQDNVRELSIRLLADLFALEQDPQRANEVLRDIAAAAEDLLRTGHYEKALLLMRLMSDAINQRPARVAAAAESLLEGLGRCAALRQAVSSLDRIDDQALEYFRQVVFLIGPAAIESLRAPLLVDEDKLAQHRAGTLIVAFGDAAIKGLGLLLNDVPWFTAVMAVELLGRIGTATVVPLLQPLLRHTDIRINQAAIISLVSVNDGAAVVALQSALRSAGAEQRKFIVTVLAKARERRAVPILLRILGNSRPLDADHGLVLDTVTALGQMGDDRVVAPLAALLSARRWFARSKTDTLRRTTIQALTRIGSEAASAAVANAGQRGDRRLRRLVRQFGCA
jgi:HEAT repeat protein